tara:strand:+ start:649 stop:2160 length:1512 start_codon:yes stop_codon:yes gene_type:complete
MKRNSSPNAPFPEIVSGKAGWNIFEDADRPRTSNLSKEMHVPLDNECEDCGINHSKMIRRHELGHVKWSPQTIGKLSEDEDSFSVEICEEVRINYLLSRKNIPIDRIVMCEHKFMKTHNTAIYKFSEYELICYLMSQMWYIPEDDENRYIWHRFANNREYESFINLFHEICDTNELTGYRKSQINFAIKTAKSLYERICTSRGSYQMSVSYRKVRNAAKILHKLREDFNEKPTDEQVYESIRKAKEAERLKSVSNRRPGNDVEGEGESEGSGESIEEVLLQTKQQLHGMTQGADMNYKPDINDMTGRWGKMDIYTPELNVNLQGKIKGGREYRPMDYGVNPKYMNRWCIDKKVFKQRQRVYGGTILIDASGSMSFTGDDILQIMQMLPAVKIAMYNSSNNKEHYSYDTGSLRIIGDKGKRVKQDYLDKWSGGGNLVDGPALRWLSKQAPKRIWVSDMYVFGKDNTSSANLLKECKQIMNQSGIVRLANIEQVKRFALELNQLQ